MHGAGGTGGAPVALPGAPAILAATPPNGATGVAADAVVSVEADLAERGLSQFRLRFSTDTDSDDTGDRVQVLSTTEQLTLTYLVP